MNSTSITFGYLGCLQPCCTRGGKRFWIDRKDTSKKFTLNQMIALVQQQANLGRFVEPRVVTKLVGMKNEFPEGMTQLQSGLWRVRSVIGGWFAFGLFSSRDQVLEELSRRAVTETSARPEGTAALSKAPCTPSSEAVPLQRENTPERVEKTPYRPSVSPPSLDKLTFPMPCEVFTELFPRDRDPVWNFPDTQKSYMHSASSGEEIQVSWERGVFGLRITLQETVFNDPYSATRGFSIQQYKSIDDRWYFSSFYRNPQVKECTFWDVPKAYYEALMAAFDLNPSGGGLTAIP